MVVLHIANIDASILGGVQVAVPAMVRAQSAYAQVALLNTHGEELNGIKTLTLGGEFELSSLEAPFNSPDIVVFHEIYRIEFIKIYKKLKTAGVPYIIIPHGGFNKRAQHSKRLKKTVANLLLFNKYIYSAQAVQYLSAAEAEGSVYKKVKSFICSNGIFMPNTVKESFLEDGIKFVYVGRLQILYKGFDMLIPALAEIKGLLREHNCQFYIYGPADPDCDVILKLISDGGLEDLVFLCDKVVGDDKRDVLLGADYFIQTSRCEGMPMGILEALSYGLPCIVTEGTGLSGIISEYGAGYSAKTSEEGIKKAVVRAIEERDGIKTLSENARKLAEDRFDLSSVAKDALEHYGNIADGFKDKRCLIVSV